MSEIERAFLEFRLAALAREKDASAEISRAYYRAWKKIKAELERLNKEYQLLKAQGQKPTWLWINEYNRARSFHDLVLAELREFFRYAQEKITDEMQKEIEAADTEAEKLARMKYKARPEIKASWYHFDQNAVLAALGIGQTGSPLYALFQEIAIDGAQAAMDALVDGILLGKNPRQTAKYVRQSLGIPLSRALTIARTETLRARRYADREAYRANSDIIDGWIWHAALDLRTCPACWALHGTWHPSSEVLTDHPNGRCAMYPNLRSWRELGFDGLEDDEPVEMGAKEFGRLTENQKREILGNRRYQLVKNGVLTLEDFIGYRYSQTWGGMHYALSARAAQRAKQQK